MLKAFLKRDIKFGTEKSFKILIAISFFVITPLISYINFSKNYIDIMQYFLLPNFEDIEYLFKNNIYFITIQVFILLSYCNYIYDDLFTYNKLLLLRYRSRVKFCITKIAFIIIYNVIFIFTILFITYTSCKILNIEINNYSILYKILLSYSIGAISLSLFNLLVAMFLKESISFLLSIICILGNLYLKTFILPGGGYIASVLQGDSYIYSITYSIGLIAFMSVLIVYFYKKIDLI